MMQAIIKKSPTPGFSLCDTLIPKMKCDEVMIKVKAAALCGTDIHINNVSN